MTNEELRELCKVCDEAHKAIQVLYDKANMYKYDPIIESEAGRDFWRGMFAAKCEMTLARVGLREIQEGQKG